MIIILIRVEYYTTVYNGAGKRGEDRKKGIKDNEKKYFGKTLGNLVSALCGAYNTSIGYRLLMNRGE